MANLFVNILLTVLLSDVECLIPEFLRSDYFQILRHAAVETREIQRKPILPENVTYYLYTSENPFNYTKLDPTNLTVMAEKREKIVFLIHGWMSSRKSDWYEDLKNAFLTTYKNYTVVQVDWRNAASQFYYVSSINTYDVARIIADLLIDLYTNYNMDLDDVLLIGHSLGGQITGFVGKHIIKDTGRKLVRIIALDPAGPLFDERPADKRLNKDDAEVVQVVHSDAGTFGFKSPCGTIDFFPNGGSSQPGCKRIDLLDIGSLVDPITCDHHRACDYFIEAILNPTELLATKCNTSTTWVIFKHKDCEEGVQVHLGDLTTNETGTFYFETNKERPFSKRKKSSGGGISLSNVLSVLQH